MDEATIKNFQQSLNRMRSKVVAAKGEAVKGLSKVLKTEEKTVTAPVKTREANT